MDINKIKKTEQNQVLDEQQVLTQLVQFMVLDIYALSVEQTHFQTCLTLVVNEIAKRLSCLRVSFGLLEGEHVKLKAISHSYEFKKESKLIHDINASMDEAIFQDQLIIYPGNKKNKPNIIDHCHKILSQRHGNNAVCSIPLVYGQNVIGALTFERNIDYGFDEVTLRSIELLALMLAPIIELKHQEQHSLFRKNFSALKKQLAKLTGPKYVLTKFVFVSSVLMVLLFSFVRIDYHVSTEAALEGRVQRVVASPVDGFISSAEVRAGDVVEKGQLMARLEDKDLTLELAKLKNVRQQHNKEYRQALALHERAKTTILSAKIRQSDAQIELITKQLARLQIVAPFTGVVIEGELDQLLGTPVERGKKLYLVAPLDDYRIILKVDEREISHIKVGQEGNLALSSMPNELLQFHLQNITPVSTSKENRNYFRVEAKLNKINKNLHPGMQGIAKIKTGQQKLIWVWTHNLIDWLRLWTWSIMP